MAKRSRTPVPGAVPGAGGNHAGEVPVVGGRDPCPCGSGRRYKACHGRFARRAALEFVQRPFAGLDGEVDWVAMREIVPAATAPVRLTDTPGGLPDGTDAATPVTVTTVLPMAWPALRRADGSILLALQTESSSGDPSRDVAAALVAALAAEPGNPVDRAALGGEGPRLQDLLAPGPFQVTVHGGFDYWIDAAEVAPEAREALDRANASAVPTARLSAVDGAYWCSIGSRRHLRWVRTDPEDALLDGMARLHAAGASSLAPGSRFVGSFRAHGLVVPVWDLDPSTEAEDLEEPSSAFSGRLADAVADTSPLDTGERRARAGLTSRQLTLR